VADWQRRVRVRVIDDVWRHEEVPRYRAHRLEHVGVPHVPPGELLFDHAQTGRLLAVLARTGVVSSGRAEPRGARAAAEEEARPRNR
jgi:hypothetical protein